MSFEHSLVVVIVSLPVFLWLSVLYAFTPAVWATAINFLLKIFRN